MTAAYIPKRKKTISPFPIYSFSPLRNKEGQHNRPMQLGTKLRFKHGYDTVLFVVQIEKCEYMLTNHEIIQQRLSCTYNYLCIHCIFVFCTQNE